MTNAPLICLICCDDDRPRVWGLAAWLMRHGSPVAVGWKVNTDPVPDWLVVCYSDLTREDIGVSRAVAEFLSRAPRERLIRVELGTGTGPADGPPLPPVLACERGPDGLLVSQPPPQLAGSINSGSRTADTNEVGIRLLKMTNTGSSGARRALCLKTSIVALTAAVAVSVALAALSVQLNDALHHSRSMQAEAIRFADVQLVEIARPLQANARQSVMIAASEAVLQRALPDSATEEDVARRVRLLTWLAEARDLSGDVSGAREAYALAFDLRDQLVSAAIGASGLLAMAELTSSAGISAYRAGDLSQARFALDQSRQYAEALLAAAPDDREAQQRMASANLNSAVMAIESDAPDEALGHLQAAITGYEALQTAYGAYRGDLANSLGWSADAFRANGQLTEAADARRREATVLAEQLAGDPDNHLTAFRMASAAHAEAALRVDAGANGEAGAALERAAHILEGLVSEHPENARYLRLQLSVQRDRAELALFENALIRAQLLIDMARRMRVNRDPQGSHDGRVLENASFDILSGQIALAAHAYEDAAVSAASAVSGLTPELESGRANARLLALRAHLLRHDAYIALGRPEAARALREALALVQDIDTVRDLRTRDLASRVLWLAGQREQAIAIRTRLEQTGYARSDFVGFWSRPETAREISALTPQRTENDG